MARCRLAGFLSRRGFSNSVTIFIKQLFGGLKMDIFTILSQAVVFLFSSSNITSSPEPIGTGFVIAYPISKESSKWIPLIVTAKHVLGNNKKIYARFNTQAGIQTALVEYNIDDLLKSNDYWEHVDNGVDICIFRTLHYDITKYQPLPIDIIASKDDFAVNDIKQTERIIYPGLLVNFMGKHNNYPIMWDG